ncbi:MAG TPA: thiol reductant ABC exporter subunit CydD [Streptosporangiales bacterium]
MKPLDPRLLRYARAAAVYVAACVVVGTVTGGLLLVQAQVLASVVAGASGGWPIALLAAVFAARAALLWAQGVLAQRSAARVKSTLRRRVVEHVVALGPAWLTGQRSGQLRTLVTQGIDALDAYFARYLPQLVLAVTVPVLVLCRLLGADVLSALTVAVTLPLVPVFLALVGLATRRRSERRWQALAVLAHHFADVVAGLPTLRVFGRARAQAAAVRRVTDAYRRESLSALRWAFLSSMVLELLTTLAIALVAVEVGLRLVEGRLDLETGLLVLLLVPEAYLPLREVGAQFHASADGLAAAGELFAVLETALPPRGTRTDVPDPGTSVLQLEAVSVRYPDAAAPVLDRVSLSVRPGEVVALTGPSGCGKSTLLSVLLGFRAPDSGRVLVGGRPLAEFDPDAWRRVVGWVPQRPYLSAGSIAENVRAGAPGLSDTGVAAALAAAGIGDVDPATRVGEGGTALSAGQRRRVALARALAREPRLLLLDEPTAGLDADTELAVVHAVRGRGVTTLLVSHRPAVLAAADRVAHLPARVPVHLAARDVTRPLGRQKWQIPPARPERPSELTTGRVK